VKAAKRFYLALGGIVAVGLAIRIVYAVIWKWDVVVWGDTFYYHHQALAIVDGHGFLAPFQWVYQGVVIPNAEHPPVFTLFLAGVSLFARSFHAHMIATCMLGAGTVAVIGLVGRRVGGDRVGLIAAAFAAVYANLWVLDAIVTSETITAFFVALLVLCAYAYWDRPTWQLAVLLGLVTGITALTRVEMLLAIPLVILPLVLRLPGRSLRAKLASGALVAVMAAVPIAPWVYRNMTTFEHPVVFSTGGDNTLANTNCDETYYGVHLGWWWEACAGYDRTEEHSEWALGQREKGLDYIRSHLRRLPVVLAARVGLMWEVYRPLLKNHFDALEGREFWAARLAMIQFYILAPCAIFGGVLLWRRRNVPMMPLLAMPVIATVAALVAFGNTRYRIPAEITIVVLAAVGVDDLWERWRGSTRTVAPSDVPEPTGEPAPPVRVPAEAGTRSQ
jgi:4-amino-4-deoxy-L-arabinose transferase-like glycosyltransferase